MCQASGKVSLPGKDSVCLVWALSVLCQKLLSLTQRCDSGRCPEAVCPIECVCSLPVIGVLDLPAGTFARRQRGLQAFTLKAKISGPPAPWETEGTRQEFPEGLFQKQLLLRAWFCLLPHDTDQLPLCSPGKQQRAEDLLLTPCLSHHGLI